jgi:hypothetical protein
MPPNERSDQDIADTAVRSWLALLGRLTPIVGQRGFHALYVRSLNLTRVVHPWLSPPDEQNASPELTFAQLGNDLGSQPAAVALKANKALLSSFTGLLDALIGPALTIQLTQLSVADSGFDHPSEGSTDDH